MQSPPGTASIRSYPRPNGRRSHPRGYLRSGSMVTELTRRVDSVRVDSVSDRFGSVQGRFGSDRFSDPNVLGLRFGLGSVGLRPRVRAWDDWPGLVKQAWPGWPVLEQGGRSSTGAARGGHARPLGAEKRPKRRKLYQNKPNIPKPYLPQWKWAPNTAEKKRSEISLDFR
ncbi:hypothetical protein V6N11_057206 [Hibiscus sabdariffa]|uniref:Uncharacterized protein n=1 Tax=Hibiscus sabdariffa TaxID=183260 RepID=A0ABR2NKM6_9ROSI